jgi:hypothetical protein
VIARVERHKPHNISLERYYSSTAKDCGMICILAVVYTCIYSSWLRARTCTLHADVLLARRLSGNRGGAVPLSKGPRLSHRSALAARCRGTIDLALLIWRPMPRSKFRGPACGYDINFRARTATHTASWPTYTTSNNNNKYILQHAVSVLSTSSVARIAGSERSKFLTENHHEFSQAILTKIDSTAK